MLEPAAPGIVLKSGDTITSLSCLANSWQLLMYPIAFARICEGTCEVPQFGAAHLRADDQGRLQGEVLLHEEPVADVRPPAPARGSADSESAGTRATLRSKIIHALADTSQGNTSSQSKTNFWGNKKDHVSQRSDYVKTFLMTVSRTFFVMY